MDLEVVGAIFNYRGAQKEEAIKAISNYQEKIRSAIKARTDIIELKHEFQNKRY